VTSGTGTGATAEANVRRFVEQGGVVIAAGSAAGNIAGTLELPVSNYLVERQPGQPERQLGSDKYYVPGSILRVAVDKTAPSAAGAGDHVDVYFNNSPVFPAGAGCRDEGGAAGRVVRHPDARSAAAGPTGRPTWREACRFEATVGQGKAFVFGPEITFRAQPHGTFKFLFNAIHASGPAAAAPGTR
jgi:hypothetical protein